jgi:sulfonate transport system substrate-binding protein
VRSIADFRGKRIAFSPSQVQSQVVLQTLAAAGLTPRDVKLVELPSSIGGDVYTSALASNEVDIAPLGGGIVAERYLRKFGDRGARLLPHPPFRDDAVLAYVPEEVLEDPAKAAALKQFAILWGRAQRWVRDHPDELARGYYVGDQGLPLADAQLIVNAAGKPDIPARWDDAVRYQQDAIDLIAPQTGRPRFAADSLFDHRFETLAAAGFAGSAAPPTGKPPR